MKFYEFEKNLVILEHFVAMAPLFASDAFMKKLSDEQKTQILKAANDAGAEFRKEVANEGEEVRTWLSTEGGMAMTRPDKTDFIKASQGVQKAFAEQRGQEFIDMVAEINAAAE